MSEDKPCPFCGTPPFSDGKGGLYCDNPLCSMKFVDSFSTAAWNTRTPPIIAEEIEHGGMPERIWAWLNQTELAHADGTPEGEWTGDEAPAFPHTEYIKASTLSALQEQNRALREALDWAYSGDGLDECALMIDRMTWPFTKPTEPSHATQIGVRKVLDAIRQRASTKQEGE